MILVSCIVSLPQVLGAMLATLGELTEYRVAFNGIIHPHLWWQEIEEVEATRARGS